MPKNERTIIMENYKEMYLILFNAITDAQKKVEEIYVNQE